MRTLKVKELCQNLEDTSNTVAIWINLWNTIAAPLLIAVFLNEIFNAIKDEMLPSAFVFITAAIFMAAHVLLGFIAHKINKNHSMLIEYQELEDKLLETNHSFNSLKLNYTEDAKRYRAQVLTLRECSETLDRAIGQLAITSKTDDPAIAINDITDTIRGFIWPLSILRERLFGEHPGEMWSYTIYIYNEKNDRLTIAARLNDMRIKTRDRHWKPGFGTVGLSFLHKEIKFIPDLEVQNTDGNSTLQDIEKYRCILALPILACEDMDGKILKSEESITTEEKALGVLVLTSSRPECYNLDRDSSFLLALTKVISIYLDKLNSISSDLVRLEHKESQREQAT